MSSSAPAKFRALTRRPSPRMADAELTHMERVAIDVVAAEAQHDAYRAALVAAGAELIDLPALDAFPDSTFVEDVLIALPETFVLCRPGAASRAGEVDALSKDVPSDRPLVRIDAPATVDGGDVLVVKRTVYVGLSTRTNADAAEQLRAALAPFGYEVRAIALDGALHLKTAVTALRPDLLVLNPRWVDRQAFAEFRQIEVADDEPFAGNTLRVGDTLFMQAAHPHTAARVRAAGMPVVTLDITDFAKAEAGLTCMSVIIPPARSRGH